jgi:hypothetical protein
MLVIIYRFRKVTKADNYCDYSYCPQANDAKYADTKSCNYYDENVSNYYKEYR